MFLTTRGRYAVMAMICMVEDFASSRVVSIKSMAKEQNLSVYYLEQLFSLLKKHGIVKSVKGPGGGYIFAKDPSQISLFEILKAVGENIIITRCGEGDVSCNDSKSAKCNTHMLWIDFGNYIEHYFMSTSLLDAASRNLFFKRKSNIV